MKFDASKKDTRGFLHLVNILIAMASILFLGSWPAVAGKVLDTVQALSSKGWKCDELPNGEWVCRKGGKTLKIKQEK